MDREDAPASLLPEDAGAENKAAEPTSSRVQPLFFVFGTRDL